MAFLRVSLGQLKSSASHLSQNSLVRNVLWMLLAHGVRLLLQSVYFVIIARVLGPEQYGKFVGATALVAILGPFASLGSGNLLVKNVSRSRTLFNEYWGNALLVTFVSSSALTLLIVIVGRTLLPETISPLLVFVLSISDLFFLRIMETAGQAFQSIHLLIRTAQLSILLGVTRLIAALALVSFFQKPGALSWAFLYLISTAITALLGVLLVHRILGMPKLAMSRIKPEIAEGLYFSVSLSAQTVYNDIDKTMLARLSTLEATGIYAAAYRLIDVAFVPVRSLLAASYAKFFQHGASGLSGSMDLAKRLTPFAGAYGIAAGLGLFLFAPVVPYVLGHEYAGAVEALRWLAPLPFLKALHYFAADTLTGAGFQGLRSVLQLIVAVFNVLANIWLIPLYSWKGAAWSSLASDGLLMLSLWLVVAFLFYQQAQKTEQQ